MLEDLLEPNKIKLIEFINNNSDKEGEIDFIDHIYEAFHDSF